MSFSHTHLLFPNSRASEEVERSVKSSPFGRTRGRERFRPLSRLHSGSEGAPAPPHAKVLNFPGHNCNAIGSES